MISSGVKKIGKKAVKKGGKKCLKTLFFSATKAAAKKAGGGATVIMGGALMYKVYSAADKVVDTLATNANIVVYASAAVLIAYITLYAVKDLLRK